MVQLTIINLANRAGLEYGKPGTNVDLKILKSLSIKDGSDMVECFLCFQTVELVLVLIHITNIY